MEPKKACHEIAALSHSENGKPSPLWLNHLNSVLNDKQSRQESKAKQSPSFPFSDHQKVYQQNVISTQISWGLQQEKSCNEFCLAAGTRIQIGSKAAKC